MSTHILHVLLRAEINTVLVRDWTLNEALIYAWNPFSAPKLIKLNETEFVRVSNSPSTINCRAKRLIQTLRKRIARLKLTFHHRTDDSRPYSDSSKQLFLLLQHTLFVFLA